ncbi:Protein arginine n-methyltransferase [Paramicrosporidium saccamoebae]|uniref:Protein arginine n-methyltransferase n=1 Tax=Paramicrosporidium saccamoebae TaxID=1246581 RepID=A0A2H9TGJ0_9FUNG|nr:Protein arginine n-methyltransferase [Paramicrosporidium saccamoebae]
MLDTVLYARDRYLATDGVILPNRASMVITAIEDAQYKEEKIHFWDNVYGFDMSSIKSWALREPLVDIVESRSVIGNEFIFKSIDIATVRKEDLTFDAPFSIKMQRSDYVHALLSYFTIDFDVPGMTKPVRFGTGPFDKYTHWKQTVFYLPTDLQVSQGDTVTGVLKCSPNDRNPRDLDITLSYERCDTEGKQVGETNSFEYHMC